MEMLICNNGFTFKVAKLGKGTPLLMVGSVDFYKQCFGEDFLNHFELILIDFRGYAKTNKIFNPADFTMDHFVGDTLEILEFLQVKKPVTLLSHSAHSLIHLQLIQHIRPLVKSVVFVGTGPNTFEAYYASLKRWEQLIDPERKTSDSRYQIKFLTHNASFRDYCKAFHARSWYDFKTDHNHIWDNIELNDLALDYTYRHVFPAVDLKTHLRAIDVPIFSMEGEADYLVAPGSEWEKFDKKIQRMTIEKAGHYPFLENARDFIKALEQNIQQLSDQFHTSRLSIRRTDKPAEHNDG